MEKTLQKHTFEKAILHLVICGVGVVSHSHVLYVARGLVSSLLHVQSDRKQLEWKLTGLQDYELELRGVSPRECSVLPSCSTEWKLQPQPVIL